MYCVECIVRILYSVRLDQVITASATPARARRSTAAVGYARGGFRRCGQRQAPRRLLCVRSRGHGLRRARYRHPLGEEREEEGIESSSRCMVRAQGS